MAKKTQKPAVDRDALLAEIVERLPRSRAGLLQSAFDAMRTFDNSVLIENPSGAAMMADIYEAVVWSLNGRTLHGAGVDEDSAGNVVKRHCAAPAGDVPCWGQAGSFLLELDGLRLRVEVDPWSVGFDGIVHVEFFAVELSAPFISETGYRSAFIRPAENVLKSLVQAVAAEAKKHPRTVIQAQAAQRLAGQVPEWLANLPPNDGSVYVDERGQLAMGFALESTPAGPKSGATRQRELRERRKRLRLAGELVEAEFNAAEADLIASAVFEYARNYAHRPEVGESCDSIWRRLKVGRSGDLYSPGDAKWSRDAVKAEAERTRAALAEILSK